MTGIDVLRRDGFKSIADGRIGLITNHTGLSNDGISTVRLLSESKSVDLVALFSPEHGFKGKLDIAKIGDSQDDTTGLKVFSLYGATRQPTAEMLAEVDTLVFDIQDIGARFYTYVSTMGEAMKAADKHGKRFVVLDRPNPIGGSVVSGPMLDAGTESFVGFHSLPIRHGMTIGELAKMFRKELNLSLQLDVIACEGWQRGDSWEKTGLLWVNPSPNMRCLTQALLYPGIGMLETTNLSVGRGTDTPFEIIGAPWINPLQLAQAMNNSGLKGVTCIPIRFTPDSSRYKEESCGGINFMIIDRASFDPIRLGIELATALQKLHGDQWTAKAANRLMGNRKMIDAIIAGQPALEIVTISQQGVEEFLSRRAKFLIYESGPNGN